MPTSTARSASGPEPRSNAEPRTLGAALSLAGPDAGSTRLPPLTNAASFLLSRPALLIAFATRFETGGGLLCALLSGGAVDFLPPLPPGTHSL